MSSRSTSRSIQHFIDTEEGKTTDDCKNELIIRTLPKNVKNTSTSSSSPQQPIPIQRTCFQHLKDLSTAAKETTPKNTPPNMLQRQKSSSSSNQIVDLESGDQITDSPINQYYHLPSNNMNNQQSQNKLKSNSSQQTINSSTKQPPHERSSSKKEYNIYDAYSSSSKSSDLSSHSLHSPHVEPTHNDNHNIDRVYLEPKHERIKIDTKNPPQQQQKLQQQNQQSQQQQQQDILTNRRQSHGSLELERQFNQKCNIDDKKSNSPDVPRSKLPQQQYGSSQSTQKYGSSQSTQQQGLNNQQQQQPQSQTQQPIIVRSAQHQQQPINTQNQYYQQQPQQKQQQQQQPQQQPHQIQQQFPNQQYINNSTTMGNTTPASLRAITSPRFPGYQSNNQQQSNGYNQVAYNNPMQHNQQQQMNQQGQYYHQQQQPQMNQQGQNYYNNGQFNQLQQPHQNQSQQQQPYYYQQYNPAHPPPPSHQPNPVYTPTHQSQPRQLTNRLGERPTPTMNNQHVYQQQPQYQQQQRYSNDNNNNNHFQQAKISPDKFKDTIFNSRMSNNTIHSQQQQPQQHHYQQPQQFHSQQQPSLHPVEHAALHSPHRHQPSVNPYNENGSNINNNNNSYNSYQTNFNNGQLTPRQLKQLQLQQQMQQSNQYANTMNVLKQKFPYSPHSQNNHQQFIQQQQSNQQLQLQFNGSTVQNRGNIGNQPNVNQQQPQQQLQPPQQQRMQYQSPSCSNSNNFFQQPQYQQSQQQQQQQQPHQSSTTTTTTATTTSSESTTALLDPTQSTNPRQQGDIGRLHTFRVNGSRFIVDSRYFPSRSIGTGAYGIVCSATDTDYGLDVAIKRIPNAFKDFTDAKRILREAQLLHSFNHPHIIALYDILDPPPPTFPTLQQQNQQQHQQQQQQNRNLSKLTIAQQREMYWNQFNDVYMVMELQQSDLYRICYSSTNSLTEDHIRYLIYQTLRGIHYMHSFGVIHRDLKPSNLLLNQDCLLKVCDLGLSRVLGEAHLSGGPELSQYVVTRWYRAPEIMFSVNDYSYGIDVWAIGCILAELYLKKPLFPGDDYIHQLHLIFDLCGTPTEDDLNAITNSRALNYIKSLPTQVAVNFREHFPMASNEGVDVIKQMLILHPKRRITVKDALEHPFFERIHSQYPPLEEYSLAVSCSDDDDSSSSSSSSRKSTHHHSHSRHQFKKLPSSITHECKTIQEVKLRFFELILAYRPWVHYNYPYLHPLYDNHTNQRIQHLRISNSLSQLPDFLNVQQYFAWEQQQKLAGYSPPMRLGAIPNPIPQLNQQQSHSQQLIDGENNGNDNSITSISNNNNNNNNNNVSATRNYQNQIDSNPDQSRNRSSSTGSQKQ